MSFNLKLSSRFISYLGQIVTSDKIIGQYPTENLKGILKMSLLFVQAAKGADKLQITKYSAFFLGHPLYSVCKPLWYK